MRKLCVVLGADDSVASDCDVGSASPRSAACDSCATSARASPAPPTWAGVTAGYTSDCPAPGTWEGSEMRMYTALMGASFAGWTDSAGSELMADVLVNLWEPCCEKVPFPGAEACLSWGACLAVGAAGWGVSVQDSGQGGPPTGDSSGLVGSVVPLLGWACVQGAAAETVEDGLA